MGFDAAAYERIAQLEAEKKQDSLLLLNAGDELNKSADHILKLNGQIKQLQTENANLRSGKAMLDLTEANMQLCARLEELRKDRERHTAALKSIAANTDDDNARDLCLRALAIDNPQP